MRCIKKAIRFLAIIVAIFLLPSCQPKRPPSFRVAALLKSSTNPFFALMWEGIKSEADRQNITVDLFWPKKESSFDFEIRFLRTKAFEYDALIFAPANSEKSVEYLRPLITAQKKIILLDSEIPLPKDSEPRAYYHSHIASDNTGGGELAALYSLQFIHPNDTVIVIAGFDLTKPRTAAFKAKIIKTVPTCKIREFLGEFDRAKTTAIVKANVKIFQGSSVIFCANDHMALGVIDALKGQQLRRWPKIIGYDSIREAQEAILRGKMAASVAQFPATMGTEGVKTIVSLINNEPVPQETLIQPKLSIRTSVIQSVDQESLPSLIKDGLVSGH